VETGNTTEAAESQTSFRVDRVRLEEVMRVRGLTITTLAAKLGMHYNGVLRIKQTQSTSMDGVKALALALDCHPFDLVVAEGFPKPFYLAQASH